jgi:tripartite-type tricarboxylate transporter receptor subunit TctC
MRPAAIAVVFLLLAFTVSAQESYPARPVKFVVPFPAGGPLDIPARLIAHKLTDHWGKAVIVENQVGASGSIGANAVARAAPDGHTLLVTVDIPLTMFPAVAKKLPYDPQKDFRPIGSFVRLQNALFVNPQRLSVSSARELVELAKKAPGKLSFSSAGIASPAHFGSELFKVIAGIDLTHVPYKGAAPAITAAATAGDDLRTGRRRFSASPRHLPVEPERSPRAPHLRPERGRRRGDTARPSVRGDLERRGCPGRRRRRPADPGSGRSGGRCTRRGRRASQPGERQRSRERRF